MRLTVQVVPRSKRPGVTEAPPGVFIVRVSEAPIDGKATAAVRKALAAHLGVAPSRISLVRGASAKRKIFHVY